MTRLQYAVPAAILLGRALVCLKIQQTTRLELGERKAASQRWTEELATLAMENNQLSNRIAQSSHTSKLTRDQFRELLRLRGEVGLLLQRVREIDRMRATNQAYQAELAKSAMWAGETSGAGAEGDQNYWPRDQFAFAGFAEPESALETTLWIWVDADLDSLLPYCTPEQRSELEEACGGRSEAEMAAVRQRMAALFSLDRGGVSFMGKRMTSPDEALLDVYFEGDGKRRRFSLKKSGDQWVVTDLVAIYN